MKCKTLVFAVLLTCGSRDGYGEESYIRATDPVPNQITGEPLSAAVKTVVKSTLFGLTYQNFPHIVSGGGWETVIVIVNMATVPIDFTQQFYDESGRPMLVTFRTNPDLNLVTTTAAVGRLLPGGSFNFALFDAGQPLKVGWATLSYDSSVGRLGAYAIMRQRTPNGTSEALVPLSAYDDTSFFLPIDNIQGFVSAIALVNPAANISSHVRLTFLDLQGFIIGSDTITIAPGNHLSFSIPARYPVLANRLGTLLVQSDTNRLAAMGLRFNPAFAFASVPIMNW